MEVLSQHAHAPLVRVYRPGDLVMATPGFHALFGRPVPGRFGLSFRRMMTHSTATLLNGLRPPPARARPARVSVSSKARMHFASGPGPLLLEAWPGWEAQSCCG